MPCCELSTPPQGPSTTEASSVSWRLTLTQIGTSRPQVMPRGGLSLPPLPSRDKDPTRPTPSLDPSVQQHNPIQPVSLHWRPADGAADSPPCLGSLPSSRPPGALIGAPAWETGRQLCPQTAVSVPPVAEGGPGSGGHLSCCLGLLNPCLDGLPQKCPGPQQDVHGAFCDLFCSGQSQRSPPCLVPIVSEHLLVPVPRPHSWDVQSEDLKASMSFACSLEQRVFSLNDTYWEG